MTILTASSALGLLASVMYVPSLPDMAAGLDTSFEMVQLTLTSFLAAFSVCMLLQGPLSDRFGRRRVLLIGIGLCGVGSLVCALAPTIEVLLAARILQAFGACAGLVVARAVVRDLFEREAAARAFATIGMATALAPSLGPVLGGQFQVLFGWRANFVFLALYCLTLYLLAAWRLPETSPQAYPRTGVLRGIAISYRRLLLSRQFLAYSAVVAGGAIGFYAFSAGAPVLLIGHMGMRPDLFGLYAMLPPLGFMAGAFLSQRLSERFGVDRMVGFGTIVGLLGSAGLIAAALSGTASALVLLGPMMLFGIGNGLNWPNASAGAMSIHPQIAGAAAALLGFAQMSGAASGTIAIASLTVDGPLPLALTIAAGGIFSAAAWRLLSRPAPPASRPEPP